MGACYSASEGTSSSSPDEEEQTDRTPLEREHLGSLIRALHTIPRRATTGSAPLDTLFHLYRLYIVQSVANGRKVGIMMNHRTFLIYFAIFLTERHMTLETIDDRQLRQIMAELSSSETFFPLEREGPLGNISKLIHSTYGSLGVEDELFGTTIAHEIRTNYQGDNPYSLVFAADLRDLASREYSLTGRQLFTMLSKTISDCRSFDLLKFYDNLGAFLREEPEVALSSSSSPPSSPPRGLKIAN